MSAPPPKLAELSAVMLARSCALLCVTANMSCIFSDWRKFHERRVMLLFHLSLGGWHVRTDRLLPMYCKLMVTMKTN